MQDKQFWNKMSAYYNLMFDKNKAYKAMYRFIQSRLTKGMRVLEVGTGTGLIARQIADNVKSVEATDFSESMIKRADEIHHASNINFSCADVFNLPFGNSEFDAVIAANILHIITQPEKALAELRRVLKPNGILIAPTYLWKQLTFKGKIQKFVMMRRNFPINTQWDKKSYFNFINNNHFKIKTSEIINASFAIACVECETIKP